MIRLVAIIAFALASVDAASAMPWPKALDLHGDALTEGAYARLGTTKLRAGTRSLAYSAEGKTLVGLDYAIVREWNAADGKQLSFRTIYNKGFFETERSEDGRTAIINQRTTLEIWDIASHKKLELHVPKKRKQITDFQISNDRRWILLTDVVGSKPPAVRGGFNLEEPVCHLVLCDTETGAVRTLSEYETGIVFLGFSRDGRHAVTTGGPITKMWSVETGKCLWDVPNYNAEEMRFTPDGKHVIAAPGGGQIKWHIWETETGKPSKTLNPPADGYVWMFQISPDGTQIARPTDSAYELWDLKTGKLRFQWPGANQSGCVCFAPDGSSLITHDTVFRRWNLTDGKNLYADVESLGHIAAVRKMFFTPEGKHLISIGDDRTARVWDVASTKLIRTAPLGSASIDVWLLSRDASALIGIDDKLVVHRWNLFADRPKSSVELREAQKLEIGLRARDARFAPDGSLVILGGPRSAEYSLLRFAFSFWDPASGKLLRWGESPDERFRGDECRLRPDGLIAATREAIYDTKTALRRGIPANPFGGAGGPTFSNDGRLMAATGAGVRIWELATGRNLGEMPRTTGATELLAFSPDSRRLVSMSADRLGVWDWLTGKPVIDWSFPPGYLYNLNGLSGGAVFSPDGRTLATGHNDGTILLRHVPEPKPPESKLTRSDLDALWNDLGDEAPETAYAAVWQLASEPSKAVEFLRTKYPLVPPALPAEWNKLIASLDSPRFAVREAASKRIHELGRAAFAPLREALRNNPSAEQAQRIEALLAELEPNAARPRGDDLRAVRAVAVLDACGTNEAIELIRGWSERGPTPRLADESMRVIRRLPKKDK